MLMLMLMLMPMLMHELMLVIVMSQCPSFFEVGSIQALRDAIEIPKYEWGMQDTRSYYTVVCEVSLTKNLRGKTNLGWKSLGKS